MLTTEDLLRDISPEQPSGVALDDTPEWLAIREARRADDAYARDKWERSLKTSDWPLVVQLTEDALAHRSKDLRLGVWLIEAGLHVQGFDGIARGFQTLTGLVAGFWERGLHPEREARPAQLRWLGNPDKLPLEISLLPLTRCSDGGRNLSLSDWRQAVAIGYEKDLVDKNGNPDKNRQDRRQAALRSGGVVRENFDEAIKATRTADFAAILIQIRSAEEAMREFQTVLDQKLGDEGPSLGKTREALELCADVVTPHAGAAKEVPPAPPPKETRVEQRDALNGSYVSVPIDSNPSPIAAGAASVNGSGETSEIHGSSWEAAEKLIGANEWDRGLSEMARLAGAEHGRARFLRRLRLAELCLDSKRIRMGVAILEELARQIEELKLDNWESAQIIGRVWGRLGRVYRNTEQSERARVLLDHLCKLDPWQALYWDDTP